MIDRLLRVQQNGYFRRSHDRVWYQTERNRGVPYPAIGVQNLPRTRWNVHQRSYDRLAGGVFQAD